MTAAIATRARLRSRPRVNALVWCALAAAVTCQQLALHYLGQSGESVWAPLAWKLVFLTLWAAATPVILLSAARWPGTGPNATRNLLRHGVNAALFIGATNLVVRLPLVSGSSWSELDALAHGTAHGIVYYGPFALIVYAVILLIGGLQSRPDLPASPATLNEPARAPSPPQTIALRGTENLRLVPVAEIEWIEADGNYVNVSLGGEIHRARERLTDVESRLDPSRFIRVHRSAIVPIRMLRAVVQVRYGDWAVELSTGHRIRVARGRRRVLQAALAAAMGAPAPFRSRRTPNGAPCHPEERSEGSPRRRSEAAE